MTKTIIAWDLGATKCTAGVVLYHEESQDLICKKSHSVKLVDTRSLDDLIDQLESGLEMEMPAADAICVGGAGQYDGESLLLEGVYPYPMSFAKTAEKRQWPSYAVIHDYAPIVCATFTSYLQESANIKRLNACPIQQQGRRVALGIGTGLGLKDGVLLPNGDFWLGKNEIGHIGIPTPPHIDSLHQQRHREIIQFLQDQLVLGSSHSLTFETLLSGPGTVRLHQFFYPAQKDITPEQVGINMRSGQAAEMLNAFAWYVGLLIGTVQLIFMPEGGIWIAGGVAMKHLDLFDLPHFWDGIRSSPAYLSQREQYPLGVLCNPQHALIGGGYYAVKQLGLLQ